MNRFGFDYEILVWLFSLIVKVDMRMYVVIRVVF